MTASAHERASSSTSAGPVLPDVSMHLLSPSGPGVGVVVSNTRCTASLKSQSFVRHVVIDVSGTPLAGGFRAGQSFGVLPPGHDETGRPHKLRLYSIASSTRGEEGCGCHISTTVKRLIDEHHETNRLYLGVASNYLCDLKPGDRVNITGPNGKRFLLPQSPHEHDYVFFATGTGIAPFRGMIRDLVDASVRSRVVLVMGVPYATDRLYHDELVELTKNHSWFTYLPTLSRERQDDGVPPMYVDQRIETSSAILAPILNNSRTLIYICGVAGMELGIFRRLARNMPPAAREQYLQIDAGLDDVNVWERRMIHKQIRPTRRVFLEVY